MGPRLPRPKPLRRRRQASLQGSASAEFSHRTGYKPIALSVEAQPGIVTRSAQYPPSEDYHFKPLNEHVQVFQRPFRIVQDVLIDASPGGQAPLKDKTSVTIKGVLHYQACDDKVCFTPQSVPLTWTVTLRPLDRERAKP